MGRSREFRPTLDALETRVVMSAEGVGSATHYQARAVPNIVYTSQAGQPQQLDLYVPKGPAPASGWPAILALPGGGWRWVKRGDLGVSVSQLARYGYVVAVADYQYADETPGTKAWPANFEDVTQAVQWLRRNSGRYDIDPGRIAVWGESAGGHLANLLGTVPVDGSKVQAVVDFYGPTDLTALYNESRQDRPYLKTLMGGTPDQVPDSYRDASPINHVSSDDPPVLIFQGTADKATPLGQSVRYADALRAAGVPVRLKTMPGVSHGFRLKLKRVGVNLLPDVLTFLDGALDRRGRSAPD